MGFTENPYEANYLTCVRSRTAKNILKAKAGQFSKKRTSGQEDYLEAKAGQLGNKTHLRAGRLLEGKGRAVW